MIWMIFRFLLFDKSLLKQVIERISCMLLRNFSRATLINDENQERECDDIFEWDESFSSFLSALQDDQKKNVCHNSACS